MTESLLDFDILLAPISEEFPCGTSKDSGENSELVYAFSELRDLTQVARRIEAKRTEIATLAPKERAKFLQDFDGKSDGPQADPKWNRIVELSVQILSTMSKDTRVLVFLTEALSRVGGMAGLRDAMKASSMTLEAFGLALFPEPEVADEPDFCLQFLAQLENSKNVEGAIDQAELFPAAPDLHWFSYELATSLEKRSSEERRELIQDGCVTLEQFQQEVNRCNATDLQDSVDLLAETLNEALTLDQTLTRLSSKKQPLGITSIVQRIKKIQSWYLALIEDRQAMLSASSAVSEPDADLPTATTDAAPSGQLAVSHAMANRDQALASLLQVASFFRRTEPHSPLSYALEQAVRWGKMPLPELLKDLVNDDNVLGEVYRRMGIRMEEDSD
jgi:type VI secretion system protein ImpA